MATEAEGILAWAVRGFADWQRNGLQSKPKAVTLAIDEYRIEADHIHQWDAECCEQAEDAWSKGEALRKSYDHWCAQNSHTPAPP